MPKIKVGVFDSGIGGVSVINAIKKELPEINLVLKSDSKHFPYGKRSIEDIYELSKPLIQELVDEGCQIIVIACNTVTTNLIYRLRQDFEIPFVGMEPMVKPAAENTRSGIIAVCATPRTLESERYEWLKENFAQGIKVLEPDCSDWAYMIENNSIDREKISALINSLCFNGADQIVLGCTHYHWIEQLINKAADGRAEVIQPEQAVITQLKKVISGL